MTPLYLPHGGPIIHVAVYPHVSTTLDDQCSQSLCGFAFDCGRREEELHGIIAKQHARAMQRFVADLESAEWKSP